MAAATYSAVVGAGGTATITIRTGSPRAWTVAQVSIELEGSPVGSTAVLRKNGYAVTPMIPTMDVAAGEPYVRLLPTDTLTVEWAGCTPGQIGKALVLYTEVGA
jgi:hypothetical protein